MPFDKDIQAELIELFAGFDSNGDGVIDKAELGAAVQRWFPGLSEFAHNAVCAQLIAEGDKNGDGKIDIREFMNFVETTLAGNGVVYEDDEDASEEDAEQLDAIFKHMMPDEVDMCRDAFIHIDMDGDGFVSLDELLQVVQSVVGDEEFLPLKEYTEPIFIVADKDKDGKLSLREFLASFAQGPGVVPREVIHACVSTIKVHLSDEEIQALQDKFRQIDTKKDGYIDSDELEAALAEVFADKYPNSKESLQEVVRVVMEAADTDQDGRLSLSEFVRSFQEDQGVMPTAFIDVRSQSVGRQLSNEEIDVLEKAFAELKQQSLVFATYEDMYQSVFSALEKSVDDASKVPELCDLIVTMAETTEDGAHTLSQFVEKFREMIGVAEQQNANVAKANANRVAAAMDRLQEMLDEGSLDTILAAFRALDVNQDDFLDRPELENLLRALFAERIPDLPEDVRQSLVDAVISSADVDGDGRLSLYEFVMSFADGRGVLPEDVAQAIGEEQRENEEAAAKAAVELGPNVLLAVAEVFDAIDTNGDGYLSADEVLQALADRFGGEVDNEAELVVLVEAIMAKADTNQDGKVSFREFLADIPRPAVSAARQQAVAAPNGGVVALHADNLSTPARQRVAPGDDDAKSPIVNDVSGCAISDAQLKKEFKRYDADNNGSLDRQEFKRAYMNMEHYGLEPTQSEVDRLFSRYGGGDRITFDEFCVIMLNRSKM